VKPTICISLCEQSIESLERALAKATNAADLIEIRLDCLDALALDQNFLAVERLLQKSQRPTILTNRPAEQGGQRELKSRVEFWLSHLSASANLLDIELDLALAPSLEETPSLDWGRVICSYHDVDGLPEDLDELYRQMAATPARILKIAVQAQDVVDCLPIFQLLDRARDEGREMIAIAMGTAGVVTRILGPSRGAFLTYCALDQQSNTAPGQLTAAELADVYKIERITRQTAIYGVMGWPVSHSLSPLIQNAAFGAMGVDAVYLPFDVRDELTFLKRMVHPKTREIDWNMRGLSVTAPHKSAVLQELDWIEPLAEEVGAVNTIVVVDDILRGYNTDAGSFLEPLLAKLRSLTGLRCAVIGAGGAASAAVWSLRKQGADVTVFARDTEKAEALATKFGVARARLEGATFGNFDLVVNATPLGTNGRLAGESPATTAQLRGARLAYDLVYNPVETQFLREAREAGCETLGGMEMFVAQAAAQFRLWTGTNAPDDLMREAAERAL
jgi:3-dehydroquinate dehydratase/shikimate dehydrogenase